MNDNKMPIKGLFCFPDSVIDCNIKVSPSKFTQTKELFTS